jgi:hypothetical protein
VFRAEDRPDLIRLNELGIVQLEYCATVGQSKWEIDVEPGKYWLSPESTVKDWRAGSYSAFNAFKLEMRELFRDSGRFSKFDRSNDSDTVFGQAACQQLLEDFEWGLPEAERHFHGAEDVHGDFIRIYVQLLDSFRIGADGGMVYFC